MGLPAPNRPFFHQPPLDLERVRNILQLLLTRTADEVENEAIEIKGWCSNEKELTEKASDAASCLANTKGGFILLGVSKRPEINQRFSRCPHDGMTTESITARIQNLTRPPVDCSVHDLSRLLTEVAGKELGNVFAVQIRETRYPGGHLDSHGIKRIRIGKECQPQYYAEDDRTSVFVPGASIKDLDESSVRWASTQQRKGFDKVQQWSHPWEFLEHARLIEPCPAEHGVTIDYGITLAALLLFGNSDALRNAAPYFETLLIVETSKKTLRLNVVETIRRLCWTKHSELTSLAPEVPVEVIRELLVNAFVHRCYRTASPIEVRVSPAGLEIKSPGELLGSVSVTNLINCVPAYRNFLLAEGSRLSALSDKIGNGIDLVYEGVLHQGLDFPQFESAHGQFIARISLAGNAHFRAFMRKFAQALGELEEVIALRLLWSREFASVEELAAAMQRPVTRARHTLGELLRKGMATEGPNSTTFQLAQVVRKDIENIFGEQLSFEQRTLWGE